MERPRATGRTCCSGGAPGDEVAAVPPHRISVLGLLLARALPARAAAQTGDAARFAAFAKRARATGTLNFNISFKSDPGTCTQAGTCRLAGTVRNRLALRS